MEDLTYMSNKAPR